MNVGDQSLLGELLKWLGIGRKKKCGSIPKQVLSSSPPMLFKNDAEGQGMRFGNLHRRAEELLHESASTNGMNAIHNNIDLAWADRDFLLCLAPLHSRRKIKTDAISLAGVPEAIRENDVSCPFWRLMRLKQWKCFSLAASVLLSMTPSSPAQSPVPALDLASRRQQLTQLLDEQW